MGRLQAFHISFDNCIATYHAGQTVSGKVFVHLTEPMEMRALYLKLEGETYVHWTVQQSKQSTRREARETYFDLKQSLWGSGVREEMPSGQYEFPFAMLLPAYLPTSFEGTYGHVRYHCKAYIDRPWKFDPKCKAPFTVLSQADLNTMPDAIKPIAKENDKVLGCWSCTSGHVSATVSLNKSGFVPGETIYMNAVIDNQTSAEMVGSYAVFQQDVVFTAKGGYTRTENTKLVKVERGSIPPYETDSWVNVPINVPSIPPTGGCEIIKIGYNILFAVDPPGLSFNLEIEMPITIGTIPLRADFSRFFPVGQYAPSIGYSRPSAPPESQFQSSDNGFANAPSQVEFNMAAQYPEMTPPTYEESVRGVADIKDDDDNDYTMGQLEYAPRYMYYHQARN